MSVDLYNRMLDAAAALNDVDSIANNPEYLRGQAELIADSCGLGLDKEDVTAHIVAKVRGTYTKDADEGVKVADILIPEGREFETWTNDVYTFRVIADPEHSYLTETRIDNPRGSSLGYRQFDTLSDLYDDLDECGARFVK